jgi:hypothetical protein
MYTGCGIGGSRLISAPFCPAKKAVGVGAFERFYHTLSTKVISLRLSYGCLSRSFPTETLHTFNISYNFALLIQLGLYTYEVRTEDPFAISPFSAFLVSATFSGGLVA